MLCVVQLVQVARNQTTHESMKGHSFNYAHPTSQALTAALAAGTTSVDIAGLNSTGNGPNPTASQSGSQRSQREVRSGGCLAQWKKLLGLDTFMATAQGGLGHRRGTDRQGNPFSNGVITNCRDFWCDTAPFFTRREPGVAMLGGEVVNFNDMYELPVRIRGRHQLGSGPAYRSIATGDVADSV